GGEDDVLGGIVDLEPGAADGEARAVGKSLEVPGDASGRGDDRKGVADRGGKPERDSERRLRRKADLTAGAQLVIAVARRGAVKPDTEGPDRIEGYSARAVQDAGSATGAGT